MPGRLQGQVILNTRPAHQQAGLSASFEHKGAQVLSFPVIDIVLSDDSALRNRLAREIAQYDILLFVSRNAVDGAFANIDARQLNPAVAFGVIGEASHRALAEKVVDLVVCGKTMIEVPCLSFSVPDSITSLKSALGFVLLTAMGF